jgi:hypothetical protein
MPGNAGTVAVLGLGAARAETAVIAIRMAVIRENRFILMPLGIRCAWRVRRLCVESTLYMMAPVTGMAGVLPI